MQNKMHKIKATKFFDVKMPKATATYDDFSEAGIDVYMPKPTKEFIDAIVASNDEYLLNVHYGELISETNNYNNFSIYVMPLMKNPALPNNLKGRLIMHYSEGKYTIFDDIQIPSGIGVLIAKGYHIDFRSKSSNFKKGYTVIKGLIDSTYTYGMGLQLHKLKEKSSISLMVDEKMAQLVLRKTEEIDLIEEVSLEDWNNLVEVKHKRTKRTGGFGSNGKF